MFSSLVSDGAVEIGRGGQQPVDLVHRVVLALLSPDRSPLERCEELITLLPSGWRHPDTTAVRIRGYGIDTATPGFQDLSWSQHAAYRGEGGIMLTVEVRAPGAGDGQAESPFTRSEQHLLEVIVDLVGRMLEPEARRGTHPDPFGRSTSLEGGNELLSAELDAVRSMERILAKTKAKLNAMELDRTLATARERRAIAADIHDNIGQSLALIRLRIGAFRDDSMFCGFDQSLDEILGLIDQTIEFSRNLSFEISPPILYELDLKSAVDWLGERMVDRYGLSVQVTEVHPPINLPEDVRVTCFSAIREALTNVANHSGSDQAWVTITRHPASVCIKVVDQGSGFDLRRLTDSPEATLHFGLFGLRGRISDLGGQCHVSSEPGCGTMVSFEVPLTQPVRA